MKDLNHNLGKRKKIDEQDITMPDFMWEAFSELETVLETLKMPIDPTLRIIIGDPCDSTRDASEDYTITMMLCDCVINQ